MLTNAKVVELSNKEVAQVEGGLVITIGAIMAVAGLVGLGYAAGEAVGEYVYNITH